MGDYDVEEYSTEYFAPMHWVQTDESERKHRQLQLPIGTCQFVIGCGIPSRAPEDYYPAWPRTDEPHRGNG